jgi:hypothetical protein
MKKSEFIKELAGVLNLGPDKVVPPDQVSECKNVLDIMNLCQGKLEG